jgi:hypothetical protein
MQSIPNLTFETLDDRAGFTLTAPSNNYINIIFSDAPENFNIGQTQDALIMMISPDIRATAFNAGDNIALYLSKSSSMPQSFSLAFENIVSLDVRNHQVILHMSNMKIYIDFSDCVVVASDPTTITVSVSNADSKLEFSTQIKSAFAVMNQNVSMQSIDGGRMLIPSSRRIPEFIISIYDDSSFVRPRPSRFGVPVISTVPGFIPDSSWSVTVPQEDKDLMELGVGTEKRKMYFKIISDQTIEGSLRDNLQLEIDMPAGVDTVVETVSLPLTYISSADVNDIFTGSYDFHKEDTVNFVDGFAYLSVRLPLKIQRNLPLIFQVSTDGSTFTNPTSLPVSSLPFDALSIENNVQPKLANSKQGSKAEKGKNNKNGQ